MMKKKRKRNMYLIQSGRNGRTYKAFRKMMGHKVVCAPSPIATNVSN